MPELPEVETMRRGIAKITGCIIQQIVHPKSRFRPILISPPISELRRRAMGTSVQSVARAGKRVVLELDSGDRIVIEPRMTGRVLLCDPPDAEHVRLCIELSGMAVWRLLFWDSRGLGTVRLMTPEQWSEELGPRRLGPDAMEVDSRILANRLGPGRQAVKVALLDQRKLAGIGNLYASEILHRAGIHPETACNRLRSIDWTKLHEAIQQVLREAIEHQGSTLSDGMYADAENRSGSYQEHHRVYQRAGERCVQCGRGQIIRLVQAQRSTFYCPRCQRVRRSRGPK